MDYPAELPKGFGRLDQSAIPIPSGFAFTRNQHDGIHKDALEISFATNSLQAQNFSNHIKSIQIQCSVILAKAGIQAFRAATTNLDYGSHRSETFYMPCILSRQVFGS